MDFMKISKLNPKVWGMNLKVKIIKKNDERIVKTKDEVEHRVTEFLIADDSGAIELTMWDENIDLLKVNKVYEITELMANVFMKRLRMSTTKKSIITKVKGTIPVNETNNLSEVVQKVVYKRKFFNRFR